MKQYVSYMQATVVMQHKHTWSYPSCLVNINTILEVHYALKGRVSGISFLAIRKGLAVVLPVHKSRPEISMISIGHVRGVSQRR